MTATCDTCAAPIVWVRTEAGKAMPLDAEPTDDGNIVMNGETDDAGVPIVKYLGRKGVVTFPSMAMLLGGEVIGDVRRYRSHFATCPDAPHHRKKRR